MTIQQATDVNIQLRFSIEPGGVTSQNTTEDNDPPLQESINRKVFSKEV